jgi:hydroxymethylpyrimidine/phosphomethylpyrimidine kinase
MIHTALSIAGSDPSGGAGIQADLKTFSAHGVYGMSALTALTVQNTQGVRGIQLLPAEFVAAQIDALFDDIRIDAIKIGMIANADIAKVVANVLKHHTQTPIILDPVMIAKGGHSLLEEDAITSIQEQLLPLADILTPNLEEAARLLNTDMATTRTEMEAQGKALLACGPNAVLMKGGHLEGDESPDLLITEQGSVWYEAQRINTANTHGTGCTLSSAIAAQIAKGHDYEEAIQHAKTYVHDAIAAADSLDIGSGHGPTHHFHALWSTDKKH